MLLSVIGISLLSLGRFYSINFLCTIPASKASLQQQPLPTLHLPLLLREREGPVGTAPLHLIFLCSLGPMSPVPNEADPEVPRMDPRILIFLLYVMILHELVSGWMEYQKQVTKPKKQAGPVWSSSFTRSNHSGSSRRLLHSARRERYRDWRKPGRIIRKA
ncbi:unnamed protein product [Caretta caretta]